MKKKGILTLLPVLVLSLGSCSSSMSAPKLPDEKYGLQDGVSAMDAYNYVKNRSMSKAVSSWTGMYLYSDTSYYMVMDWTVYGIPNWGVELEVSEVQYDELFVSTADGTTKAYETIDYISTYGDLYTEEYNDGSTFYRKYDDGDIYSYASERALSYYTGDISSFIEGSTGVLANYLEDYNYGFDVYGSIGSAKSGNTQVELVDNYYETGSMEDEDEYYSYDYVFTYTWLTDVIYDSEDTLVGIYSSYEEVVAWSDGETDYYNEYVTYLPYEGKITAPTWL